MVVRVVWISMGDLATYIDEGNDSSVLPAEVYITRHLV